MKIKLLKDFRGKETREIFYLTGSVVDLLDIHAKRLLDLGFAEKFSGGEGGVVPPPPPVDPELKTKSMMTPKVAALVAKDNDAIIQSLREELLAEEEVDEPAPAPAPATRRGKKAKK